MSQAEINVSSGSASPSFSFGEYSGRYGFDFITLFYNHANASNVADKKQYKNKDFVYSVLLNSAGRAIGLNLQIINPLLWDRSAKTGREPASIRNILTRHLKTAASLNSDFLQQITPFIRMERAKMDEIGRAANRLRSA